MYFNYLPGLNTLRFLAAFFVIISHARYPNDIFGEDRPVCLDRGGDAVDFFFTLSGFLITYLLIQEIQKTGTISIKKFYLRRVYRIWPLYFLIVGIGFFLLGYIYPKIFGQSYLTIPVWQGILLFIFFLPNYAAKTFNVGLMNPLWSIGVEEQFYLFWAPLMKAFRKHIFLMILIFMILSIFSYSLFFFNIFNLPKNYEAFFLTQKFYAMSIGALFAFVLFYKYHSYNRSIFSSKPGQAIVILIIVGHYLFGYSFSYALPFKVILAFLYGMLIMNVSVIERKLFNLEQPLFTYLGLISYGLYMYHMIVDYLLRIVFPKIEAYGISVSVLVVLYYVLLVLITVGISAVSYSYFEKFFLNLKSRLHDSTK